MSTRSPDTTSTAASYSVAPSVSDAPHRRPRTAVFTAHGMGQQIAFQTMDEVARELLAEDAKAGSLKSARRVRTVQVGAERLSRVELELGATAQSPPRDVHIYEAYWAPMLEGKVTLRAVMTFLAGAGRNGVRNAHRGEFNRWLFDRYDRYPISVRTLFYLLCALATVASLIVANVTIGLVSAGRALLAPPPPWLSSGLFEDLTTVFNVVITAMTAFGIALAIGVGARAAKIGVSARRFWAWVSVLLFVPALTSIIVAGITIPVLFYTHVRRAAPAAGSLLDRVFPGLNIGAFNGAFDRWAWLVVAAIALVFGGLWLWGLGAALIKDVWQTDRRVRTVLVALGFGGIAFLGGWVVWSIARTPESAVTLQARSGLAWILLVAISAYLRVVLVQFLGDVAAYITPHQLDAFSDVRDEIKDCAFKIAKAIYAMKAPDQSFEYDRVIVVGHSLGSVVVYDTLNRLIREDEAAGGTLKVVERTPLLLTFGSPLDKTAFIFSLQGRGTSEAREALAASVQPMLRSYAHRPLRWINIYSPWDIISGRLDFYDPRESTDPRRVENVEDRDATTFLIAHTEYWTNPMFVQCLRNTILDRAPAREERVAPGARGAA